MTDGKVLVPMKLLDAAVELNGFCKHHEYPSPGSSDFEELMRLVDVLDTAIRQWKRQLAAAEAEEGSK